MLLQLLMVVGSNRGSVINSRSPLLFVAVYCCLLSFVIVRCLLLCVIAGCLLLLVIVYHC